MKPTITSLGMLNQKERLGCAVEGNYQLSGTDSHHGTVAMKQEARNKYVALCDIDVLQELVQKCTRLSSPSFHCCAIAELLPKPFLLLQFCYHATRRVVGYKSLPLNPFIVTGIVSINLVATV